MSMYDHDIPLDALYSGSGAANVYSRGAVIKGFVVAQGSAVGTVTILTSTGGTIKTRWTIPARTQGQGTFFVPMGPTVCRPRFRLHRQAGGTGAGINARMKVTVFYWKVRDRAASV